LSILPHLVPTYLPYPGKVVSEGTDIIEKREYYFGGSERGKNGEEVVKWYVGCGMWDVEKGKMGKK